MVAVCLALLAAGGGSQCHYRAEAGDQAESGITPVSHQTARVKHHTSCIILSLLSPARIYNILGLPQSQQQIMHNITYYPGHWPALPSATAAATFLAELIPGAETDWARLVSLTVFIIVISRARLTNKETD